MFAEYVARLWVQFSTPKIMVRIVPDGYHPTPTSHLEKITVNYPNERFS